MLELYALNYYLINSWAKQRSNILKLEARVYL